MADEPIDLVLIHLREIRGKLEHIEREQLAGMRKDIDEIRKDIDEMRKEHGELRTWVQLAIGQGVTNQLKSGELEARIAALERLRDQPR